MHGGRVFRTPLTERPPTAMDNAIRTVNRDEASAILGVAPSAVTSTLSRQGVTSIGREPGRGGQNLYDRAAVERVAAKPKTQGRRTDLLEEHGDRQ